MLWTEAGAFRVGKQKGKGKQVTKGTSHTEAPASVVVGDCGGTCGCVPYRLRVLGMLGSSLSDRDLFGALCTPLSYR